MNCSLWQLSKDKRYELSLENAVKVARNKQPITMFWCLVDNKYKDVIWEQALELVEKEQVQKELF